MVGSTMESPRPRAASTAERLAALMVDVVVVLGILAATTVAVSLLLSRVLHILYRDAAGDGLVATNALALPILAAAPVLLALAYLVALPGLRGATVGMRLVGVGLVVDRPDGGHPGVGRTSVRLLVFALGSAIIAGPVALLLSPDGRGWHDRLSGTIVTRQVQSQVDPAPATAAGG